MAQGSRRILKTPLGNMVATVCSGMLVELDFVDSCEVKEYDSCNELLLRIESELNCYFQGTLKNFTIPLNPHGTLFQKSVWEALCHIAYGNTISYADEAEMIGKPKAYRAVANANGKNPISIIIPCHRVVSSDGGIGGYTGGIWRKEFLLKLESD